MNVLSVHPWVVVLMAKGSSFPERDRNEAACPGSGQGQHLQEQDRDKPVFPGGEGWRTEIGLTLQT